MNDERKKRSQDMVCPCCFGENTRSPLLKAVCDDCGCVWWKPQRKQDPLAGEMFEAIGELAKRTFELEKLKSNDWWMECVDCCHCGYMPDITSDGRSFGFICSNKNCFRQSAKTNDISSAITAWNQKIREEEK